MSQSALLKSTEFVFYYSSQESLRFQLKGHQTVDVSVESTRTDTLMSSKISNLKYSPVSMLSDAASCSQDLPGLITSTSISCDMSGAVCEALRGTGTLTFRIKKKNKCFLELDAKQKNNVGGNLKVNFHRSLNRRLWGPKSPEQPVIFIQRT